jgi:tetratricopeptide (TPR) repeat protein
MRIRLFRCWMLALAGLVIVANQAQSVSGQERAAGKPVPTGTVEAHLGQGYDALKQDNYDLAAKEFRAALELDPTLTLRARFPLAVALFELHQSKDARQEFETVRRETGEHPNVSYYLGRLDLEDRDFEGAIRNLKKAVVRPPFPDTAYYLGIAYFRAGDANSSEEWLKQAAQLNPSDSRIPYQLGLVYPKLNREEDAKKALALSEQLRQREDNESRLRLECAQKLDSGPREEAHAVCEQLYDPDDAQKLTALGTIYGGHGDLEAALKPLRRAAELAPQSPQMQYNLALAYYQLNQFEQARGPLAGAIKRWPDLFQLNALYGAVLLKLGEELPAYQALHHALQLSPQDSQTAGLLYTAALGLARKSQDARRYLESLRYLEEAAKLAPREPEPHRRMAEIYTITGRSAQATAEQQAADRLTANSAKEN